MNCVPDRAGEILKKNSPPLLAGNSYSLEIVPRLFAIADQSGIGRPNAVITLRRPQIARPFSAHVYNDFLEHYSGIYHAHLERVIACRRQNMAGFSLAHAVLHGRPPIAQRVLRHRVNDL